jgi:hypothetical protein
VSMKGKEDGECKRGRKRALDIVRYWKKIVMTEVIIELANASVPRPA